MQNTTQATITRPQAAPESCTKVEFPPVVRMWIAKAMYYFLSDTDSSERLLRRNGAPIRPWVSRYLGRDLDDYEDHDAVCTAWDQLGVRCWQEAGEYAGPDPCRDLARQIGSALSLTPVLVDLVHLAISALRYPELRRAMDLSGPVCDYRINWLFGAMLSLSTLGDLIDSDLLRPLLRMSDAQRNNGNFRPSEFLAFADPLARKLSQPGVAIDEILSCFLASSPEPKLTLADFSGMGADLELMQRFLGNLVGSARPGVNILLHGKPGTGKTEFVRALAKELGFQLQEVRTQDEEKQQPFNSGERLLSYRASQEVIRQCSATALLFDEVEDVFPVMQDSGGPSFVRRRPGAVDRNKGWMTQLLENNPRPAFWVSNSIDQIDSALLRRFSMVVEMPAPNREVRLRVASGLFSASRVSEETLRRLTHGADLELGHLQQIATVLETLKPRDEQEASRMIDMLQNQTRRALAMKPVSTQLASSVATLPYRADCVNTDCPLDELAGALSHTPSARICLYGAPGTGKTRWVHELADRLERPLLIKRASDLLNKYVGETEARIRAAFEQAANDDAVLLIDEADSFLQSRVRVDKNWEASMVNEMLTAMEGFEGIFVASTNFQDRMDPASARRFDFKVKFATLTAEQARSLFADLLAHVGADASEVPPVSRFLRLDGLTPGDFANVARQVRLTPSRRTAPALLALLEHEIRYRCETHAESRRIGFV